MGPLVGRLKDELASMLCDQPYAFFGYSMGARVAFALSRAVRDAGLPGPQMLFVAASPGPSLAIPVPGWQEPDTGLVEYLEDVGGTPSEVLAKQELMELLLPTIRADLTAVATWPYSVQDPLSCPIRAIAGERDDYASPDRMSAWKAETAADFKMSVLQGDHFFLHTDLARIVEIVNNDLAAVLESTDSRLKRTLDQPNGFSHNIR
jgi:surfactin synthase thioesterase subunit